MTASRLLQHSHLWLHSASVCVSGYSSTVEQARHYADAPGRVPFFVTEFLAAQRCRRQPCARPVR